MLTRLRAVRMGHRAPGRRAGGNDAGQTLVELMVGMTLMSIFGAVALSFFLTSSKQTDRTAEESLVGADVRVAIESIGTLLRYADTPTARAGFPTGRFEVLTPYRIVFYTNLKTDSRGTATTTGPPSPTRTPPTKIDISIANGQLVEKTYEPKIKYTTYPSPYDYTANYPDATQPTTTVTLLRAIANDTQKPPVPVFTYCTSATEPATLCTPATNANSVAAVGIELIAPGKTGTSVQRATSTVAISGAVS